MTRTQTSIRKRRIRGTSRNNRRGNVLVMSALLMVAMMAMLAFALDMGVMYCCRSELQRCADSAALAGGWELIDENAISGSPNATMATDALVQASQFAGANAVMREAPALGAADCQLGYLANPFEPGGTLDVSGNYAPNAVTVTVKRTASQNGEIPTFFGRVLGHSSVGMQAQATAALVTSINGIQIPSDGSNVMMLPFALDEPTYLSLMAGTGTDDYGYDPSNKAVNRTSDGIVECNLYPKGAGSAGNRGTLDIGSANNSTQDIARQIVDGISPSDLEYHGGKLELNDSRELDLHADTGISSGVKDELASIEGQPRLIPIFRRVVRNGDTADYTIVCFMGCRVMHCKLTGSMSSKKVMIQPCNIVMRGGIPSTDPGTSSFIYSPVWLVK